MCIGVGLDNGNLYKWKAFITGPDNTPYEGGMFLLEVNFPDNYPSSAPQVFFKTPIFHPNIYTSGKVCVSLLTRWSPEVKVSEILLVIVALLARPNTSDPANRDASTMLDRNKAEFDNRVREETRRHAM